jgi:transposase-like protein
MAETELDILLQKRRDKAAAKRCFTHVLAACPDGPRRIVTDQLRSYPAAKAEIPEIANVKDMFVKASARVNHRADNSHQPTREGERRIPQVDCLRARLPAARAHSGLPVEHRPDPAALRAQAPSSTRLALSQTPRRTL